MTAQYVYWWDVALRNPTKLSRNNIDCQASRFTRKALLIMPFQTPWHAANPHASALSWFGSTLRACPT